MSTHIPYLLNYSSTSVHGRVYREWNSGHTLREAVTHLQEWYGITAKQVIPIWRNLYRSGAGSIPLLHPHGDENTDPRYLAWKGIIGPGKEFREVIAQGKLKADT